uniref:Uncharacterized protein n=1 Tax=Aegilops tauschii TaxID=37682 RepID=N1R3C8_AEGTA
MSSPSRRSSSPASNIAGGRGSGSAGDERKRKRMLSNRGVGEASPFAPQLAAAGGMPDAFQF